MSVKKLNRKEKDPVEDKADEAEQHEAHEVVLRLEEIVVSEHGLDLANRIDQETDKHEVGNDVKHPHFRQELVSK